LAEQQDKLVQQQGEIIGLLSKIADNHMTTLAAPPPNATLVSPTLTSSLPNTAVANQVIPIQVTPPPSANKPPPGKPETWLDLLDSTDPTDDDLDFLNSPSWLSSDKEMSYQLPTYQPHEIPPLAEVDLLAASSTTHVPPTTPRPPPVQPAPQILGPTPQSSRQYALSTLPSRKKENYVPPPHFSTPPKLKPVEQVMRDYPGDSLEALRRLAGALARDAIFGRDTLRRSSLSGRPKKGQTTPSEIPLDEEKMEYIKTVVRSRLPNTSALHFEAIWSKCRNTISKACQTLRDSTKKKVAKN